MRKLNKNKRDFMNKKILLIGICVLVVSSFMVTLPNYASEVESNRKTDITKISKVTDYPREALEYKRLINRINNEREVIYNALNLTDEQVEFRENMLQEDAPIYEQKFDVFMKESFKLKALEEANASESEILEQKRVVKKSKKDIEKFFKKENKKFKKCLTSLQRAKFREIQHLEKHDFKKEAKQKDYYKSNPQMRPFGNPATLPNNGASKSKKKMILK